MNENDIIENKLWAKVRNDLKWCDTTKPEDVQKMISHFKKAGYLLSHKESIL